MQIKFCTFVALDNKCMDRSSKLSKKEGNISRSAVDLFEQVRQKIVLVRDCQVILDADVAALYGVETKRINEAVRNNPDKFPENYMFTLTPEKQQVCGRIFRPQISPQSPAHFLRHLRKKGCTCWRLFSKAGGQST